jgi:hypothetical protein
MDGKTLRPVWTFLLWTASIESKVFALELEPALRNPKEHPYFEIDEAVGGSCGSRIPGVSGRVGTKG